MPVALITGITGQDGSYLADLLLSKGYQVLGMVRRSSTLTFERIQHIQEQIHIVQGDLHDQSSLVGILEEYLPDEVYNLAAQSFVPTSWSQPVLTGEVTGLGVTRLLEAIRHVKPAARFYQASTSEMFGKVVEVPSGKQRLFTLKVLTALQRSMGTGSPLTTANRIIYLQFLESYSTMKAPAEGWNLWVVRLPTAQYALSWARPMSLDSVTWNPDVIGVLPAIMSRRCG